MAAKRVEYAIELLLGAKKRSNFDSTVSGVSSGIDSIGGVAKKVAAGITAAFAAVNVKDAIADAMETYTGFEQATANTAAIAGASKAEYDKLEKAARDAGAATTKTAEESSEALGYMALAGWNVNDSIQGLMPVLKLSESAQLYLAETSDLVTDSMSAMKLSVKDLPEYLDAVVQGNNSANMNAQQMMESMILSGGAARTLSINYQDLGTAIGILANNGTKGKKAGTAMNAMLTRIASNDSAIKMMDKLNISIFDANGRFIGLEGALKNINAGISGLTMEDQAKALKEIAGTQYYSKMTYLLDSVKEGANGAESAWGSLNEQLYDSDGALDKMDAQITGTANGAKQIMQSAMDDAKISFGDAFSDEYVAILNDLAGGFNTLSENITEFADENEIEIHDFFEAVKDSGKNVMDFVGNIADFVKDNSGTVIAALEGIGATLVAGKIASGVLSIVSAISALTPAGLAVMGVAAAFGTLAGVMAAMKNAEKEAAENSIDEHFGKIALSLDQIDDAAQQIVGKKQLTKISTMLDKIGDTDKSIQSLSDNLKTVGGIEWKMKAGLQLSKDDEEQYTDQIKDAITNAQNIIDSQGYTVSLATDLLLGSNSKIGDENDAFYAGLDAQMNTLQKKLNKKISAAVKNGVDIDKDAAIQNLLGKMTEITDAVTGAENKAQLQTIQLKYSGKELNGATFKELSKDIAKYEEQITSGAQEAYQTSMTNLNARLSLGDIDQKQYDSEKSQLEEGYFKTRAEAYSRGYQYIIDTIQSAYPELKGAMSNMSQKVDEALQDSMKGGLNANTLSERMNDIAKDAVSNLDLDKDTRNAIYDLFENGMNDVYNQMTDLKNEMANSGYEVPESLANNIETTDTMLATGGDKNDVLGLLGDKIGNSAEYTTLIKTAEKAGGQVPTYMADGIRSKENEVADAVDRLFERIQSQTDGKTLSLRAVHIDAGMAGAAVRNDLQNSDLKGSATTVRDKTGVHTIYRNALGGIYNRKILTTIAEEGAEAVIPLDGSNRGKTLWMRAGQMLGMFGKSNTQSVSAQRDIAAYNSIKGSAAKSSKTSAGQVSGNACQPITVTYSPKIVIEGSADKKAVEQALDISQKKFEQLMDRYNRTHKRISFGGAS